MKDLMGTEEGQSASMDTDGSEESDWFHNNGLAYDAGNDLLLLSARHKDAIVAVNMEDKSLAWILGDPTGWGEDYQSYFFNPEGEDFEWFYAQHNVSILDNVYLRFHTEAPERWIHTTPALLIALRS